MSSITVRFVHRQSRTPVLELEVEASATVGALRELLMDRLASEEVCMMRVFVKWHAEIEAGGRRRLIELTDEDSEALLSSIGISHLSEVHLEGPLTGDGNEGVGQALAVLGAQIHRMDKGQALTNTLLQTLVAQISTIIESQKYQQSISMAQLSNIRLTHLPSEAYVARQALVAEEGLAYGLLIVMEGAEEGYQRLVAEATTGLSTLSIEAHYRPFQYTIDRTTPHTTFTISDDGTTATKTSSDNATFRASQPLTAANPKWAVKIVENCGRRDGFIIGLLPKLSSTQVARMENEKNVWSGTNATPTLGGWGMFIDGTTKGAWECPPFTFAKGDVVVFELNVAAKTLTLSCGDRKAVGTIPSIKEGDELYPAVYMYWEGMKVEFITQ